MGIYENVKRILSELPEGVELVAAAKTRTADEIKEAIRAGVKIIGENYLQEAEDVFPEIGQTVKWHFIGAIQKRKVKKIVELFDMVETLGSEEIAFELEKRASQQNKNVPVLIEINSGEEPQKAGIFPENTISFIEKIHNLSHIHIMGLMTMGPLLENPEDLRPYFRLTKELFETIREKNIPNIEMRYLSMGMSASYKIAIEEEANIVRIGTLIFGPRKYK